MEFKIRNIRKEHKDKIYKLIEEINLEDNLNYSLTNEWLDYVIENASRGIFLAFHGEKLAGMGTAMINPVYGDQCNLNVTVSPSYRRKGLGSMLYDHLYEFSKKENIRILEAYVKESLVSGLKFAEKRNFKTSMCAWEMELDLKTWTGAYEKNPSFNLRKAREKDGIFYKNTIFDGFGDEIEENSMVQVLEDPSINIYILEKENKAIGSATVQIREDLDLAYIYDIAILKDYRGQGLGSYLISSCLREIKEKNISLASLSVIGENSQALELYKKIGFKEVDIDFMMLKEIE